MKNRKRLQQITNLTIKLDEYLKTVKKSLSYDGDSSDDFVNHYWDVLTDAEKINWQIQEILMDWDRELFAFEFQKELKRRERHE